MNRPRRIPAVLILAAMASPLAGQTVHVSRMWHNHQPTYWPEWNSNGPQVNRVEYALDSMIIKPARSYPGSTAQHPENNLTEIFGSDDRRNSYQSGPRNSLAALGLSAGFCLSYSGSLIDGVRSLGAASQNGYQSNWSSGNREARNWRTPAGSRRMDLVGFTYHHSLAPLLPKGVLRKEIQIMKQAYWKAWGGNSDLSDQSKGFFPTEMAFSKSIIDVLVEEGFEWSIVASHHLSRTCPTYLSQGTISNNRGIYSSLPNKADLLGPSPTTGWWYGEPNPGNAAWNVSPFAYQLHRATYVDPQTGVESSLLLVPSDDVLSYRFGYASEGIGKIQQSIAPFANDPSRPVIVMPSTDGDNAWGGGSSSWFEATPDYSNAASAAGYQPTAVQDFVNQHGAAAGVVHIEDGAWIFPESCYGSANFLKWIEPPLAATAATRYAGTMADLETPGFALKFWAWAPVITGANWCETAEQILRDEGGDVQTYKIQAPYDWDGTNTNPNDVELAWHIYLHGLDSGFNYYGGLGNDDEVKAALATTRAIEKLQPFMTAARKNKDRTAPSLLKPQRYPYNPGTYNFGWFNRNPPVDNSYLKKLPSEFYVWTHAYDVSGVAEVTLKVRMDQDGVNSMANHQNETFAGGSETGEWVSIPMTKRILPNTRESLNAAANNGQINYFITPLELADYYFAKVSQENLPNFRGKLIDYYIEAKDALDNIQRSDIQHVFVEDDQTGGQVLLAPSGVEASAVNATTLALTWQAVAGASEYRIYRDGILRGTTVNLDWLDLQLAPSTRYSYVVRALSPSGESPDSLVVQATTLPPLGGGEGVPFTMDGTVDFAGYRISNPGMTLHAALRGNTLYVATWAPGDFGNDHFIMVGAESLAAPATPAPWGKAGFTALPSDSPFLAAESSNSYIGWFNINSAGFASARAAGGQMEGTVDLAQVFGEVPANLHLSSLAYQTTDGGLLGSQAPAGNGDGNLDAAELLRIPVESLRDEDANGIYDRLESGAGFAIKQVVREGRQFTITWNCFPGRSYQIQSSSNLLTESWVDVPDAQVTAGELELESSHQITLDPAESARFFRVVLLPQ
jgi:hypothetical protein